MEKEFIVFSDIHLEKFSNVLQNTLLGSINKFIAEKRNKNIEPVFLVAGDINNGTKGFDFLEKLDANSFYIAGNHEFWGNDYFQLTQELIKKSNSKVTFLHNEISIVDNKYLIVGATLWTDAGKTINPAIKGHVGSKINDIHFINAKKQLQGDVRNVSVVGVESQSLRNTNKWNVDIQIEENQKTVDFFHSLYGIILILEKFKDEVNMHNRGNKLNYEKIKQEILTVKEYAKYREVIGMVIGEIINPQYLSNKIEEDFKRLLISEESFNLLIKLRGVKSISDLKIIFLTHHAPFLEELWLARHDDFVRKEEVNLLTQQRGDLFLARDENSFFDQHYLYRCAKGDYDRYEDITIIFNYYNNLSLRLHKGLMKRINVWVHGHDHYVNFESMVKNILVVNNAVGYGLSFLGQTTDVQEQLDKWIASHFRVINDKKMTKKGLKDRIICEAIEQFNFNDFSQSIDNAQYMIEKLFALNNRLLKNLKINEREFNLFLDSLSLTEEKIRGQISEFNLYIDIQTDIDCSIDYIIAIKNNIFKSKPKKCVFMPFRLFETLLVILKGIDQNTNQNDLEMNVQTLFQLKNLMRFIRKDITKIKQYKEQNRVPELFINKGGESQSILSDDRTVYKKIHEKWDKVRGKYNVEQCYILTELY